ncbi:MAG TPA: Glu/Leu/Phe/Val dehydrogenase dimerization domain-containing protein [Longimicrobiales bacterium]|nr:Glu/Leu/Phe/Val dehydrogenase dimerization domain-containing protein [Longimicrobiales bacterium]
MGVGVARRRDAEAAVWRRYGAYLRESPDILLRWRDRETDARGYLVINSLRGGAAGGGTRMRAGLKLREVVYLAKAMELKFALAGPPIGGAKAGIDFDPHDPRRGDVLERWYRAISPYLRSCYGTGGDLNVDEVTDVIPTFQRLGFAHPQEGVVRGHLGAMDGRFENVISLLQEGVNAPVGVELGLEGRALTVADLITGYGVARAVERFLAGRGRPVEGTRVTMEGFGNVGAACALYLARAGARVVAVADAEKVLLEPDGLDAGAVAALLRASQDKLLPEDPRCVHGAERDRFWDTPADVFVAAALSGTLDRPRLARLERAGVGVLAAGANNPFREQAIGFTRVQRDADRRFAVLPDVLANCGMARTFSYLMEEGARASAQSIFPAVDACIATALGEALERTTSPHRGLLAATLAVTLDRIGG